MTTDFYDNPEQADADAALFDAVRQALADAETAITKALARAHHNDAKEAAEDFSGLVEDWLRDYLLSLETDAREAADDYGLMVKDERWSYYAMVM